MSMNAPDLDALTHNAGKHKPLTRRCRVCGNEEWQWHGYIKDKDGRWMNFCNSCKEKWVEFAQQYGIRFGYLGTKHNACPLSGSLEDVKRLWNSFLKKKIWKMNLELIPPEKVAFT